MGEFKRSPSKVWWASDSVEWREVSSSSPGSQDSGFSDSEHPTLPKKTVSVENFLKKSSEKPQNLSKNCTEKTTPDKSFKEETTISDNSRNVNRSLFKSDQYANDASSSERIHYAVNRITPNSSCVTINEESFLPNKSAPEISERGNEDRFFPNKSAPPGILQKSEEDEEVNNSLSSDCESELECLFNPLESPKHTSTPKAMSRLLQRKNKGHIPLNLFRKYTQQRYGIFFLGDFLVI